MWVTQMMLVAQGKGFTPEPPVQAGSAAASHPAVLVIPGCDSAFLGVYF